MRVLGLRHRPRFTPRACPPFRLLCSAAAQAPTASLRSKSTAELQAEQRRRVEQKQAKQAACSAFVSHHAVRLPQLKQVLKRAESLVSFRRQEGFVNYGELCSVRTRARGVQPGVERWNTACVRGSGRQQRLLLLLAGLLCCVRNVSRRHEAAGLRVSLPHCAPPTSPSPSLSYPTPCPPPLPSLPLPLPLPPTLPLPRRPRLQLFDAPASSPEAAALFAAYVREGAPGSVQAGRANMRELLLALCGFSATTAEQRVRFVFDLFDSDGSNTLSTAELTEVLKANHYSGDEEAARRKLAVVLRDSTRTGDVVDVNLSIGDFMALTKRFPNVFFPVVRVPVGEAGGSGEPTMTAEGAGALVSASTRFGPYGGAAAASMRGSSIRARPSSTTGGAGGLAAASGTGAAAAGAGASAALGSRAGVTGGAARGSITMSTPARTSTLPPISAVETPGDAVASPPASRRLLSSLFGASNKVAPSPQ